MSPASAPLGGVDRRLGDARLDQGVGVGRLEDRLLLLMPGALAEHAVQAQADEQGHQGEDDDDGQACGSDRCWVA